MGRYLFTSKRSGLKPLSKSIEGLDKDKQYVSLYYSRLEDGLVIVTNLLPNDVQFDPTFTMLSKDASVAYKKYILRIRHMHDSQDELVYCNKILTMINQFSSTL